MKTELTAWQRVEQVICWAGLNTSAFASVIGLSSPQTLYQIKAAKHGISRDVAERIAKRYPQVSFAWLLSGEGDMLRRSLNAVPYYKTECTNIVLQEQMPPADDWMNMPECGDCAFAAPCNSRSMEPEIRQGSLLFCKEVSADQIVQGGTYLFRSGQTALVRKAKVVQSGSVRFGTPKSKPFEELETDLTLLRKLYFVKAVLEWKTI